MTIGEYINMGFAVLGVGVTGFALMVFLVGAGHWVWTGRKIGAGKDKDNVSVSS